MRTSCPHLHRSDLRALALLCGGSVELECVVDPRPLGVSIPNPREHPPVAAGGLHLRPHLHHRHPRLPAQTAVRPWRRHRGQWIDRNKTNLFLV